MPLNVLVVSYRAPDLLAGCLDSVATWLPDASVNVWDNASEASDAIRRLADRHPDISWTFSPTNIGFAAAVNRLVDTCGPGDLLLLNPDARLVGDLAATRDLVRSGRSVAAAAPLVRGAQGRAWDNAHRPPNPVRQLVSYAGYAGARRAAISDLYPAPPTGPVGYLTGACLVVNRRAWDEVGPFDERYFLYSEEADWAARARRAGWTLRLVDEPGAEHVAGGTVADSQPRGERSRRLLRESQIRYLGDHHGRAAARVYAAATAGLDRVQRSKRRLAASAGRPHVVITSNTLDVGGAERQRILLANGLAARGYPVTLSLLQHEGQLRAEVDERVDVVVTPWRVPRPDVATSAVVITGTTNTEAAFGMLWRHSALGHGRRRWLVAAHTAPQPAGATYPRRLARFLRRSDGVIALSRTQWDQLVAHQNLHRDRPFVVANGIPEPPDRPDRPPRPAGAPIRLAFVGRLVEAKGVQIAVEALARITDRAWTLDVWGDGPYRATLESGVPSELADRIRFRGWTADPAAVLADADLVILPSWLEAQPLALLEAMWAGVPVLANPVGAIPEMLAGGAGLLTRGPDVASWHRALRDVLDDPQRLGPIGTAGLDRVRTRYTVTAMLDGYEDAIAEVLAR